MVFDVNVWHIINLIMKNVEYLVVVFSAGAFEKNKTLAIIHDMSETHKSRFSHFC